MPSNLRRVAGVEMENLLDQACYALARAIRPTSVSDIRAFDGERNARNDARLAGCLIEFLLDELYKMDEDDSVDLAWTDYQRKNDARQVLQAPVETTAELVEWLRVRFESARAGAQA